MVRKRTPVATRWKRVVLVWSSASVGWQSGGHQADGVRARQRHGWVCAAGPTDQPGGRSPNALPFSAVPG
jgi:hypothetical protein